MTCSLCDKPVDARGWCKTHYHRWYRSGDPLAEPKRRPNRSGCVTDGGYVRLMINGVRIYEHRYVMEQHLGRELLPTETVHHKNGNRRDNSLENLELWTTRHPSGVRFSDLGITKSDETG